MTKSAFSNIMGHDDYNILRHLFSEAMKSSTTDGRWTIHSTYSDPGNTMLTSYLHVEEGAVIKCQSFDYLDGAYRKHIFTFRQDVDADSGLPNATAERAASAAPIHHLAGRQSEDA